MAFREVTMVEIREVLRQWLAGAGKRKIAARLGLDPKTVRRYARAGEACGLAAGGGEAALTDELLAAVVATLGIGVAAGHEHGDAWRCCEQQRDFIAEHLRGGVRLSKVRRLMQRQGIAVPYSTLHRFASSELGFGRPQVTLPVVDGAPGEELQVDTGWMTLMEPDERGRRRRFRAWIFTPAVSRYRFVYPCLRETIESAIEAFEAAWDFYGGVFKVAIPDNTKVIVQTADPLEPKIAPTFLEYAQARGLLIDPARVRTPTDKGRVERSVRDVRDDCFGGEVVRDVEHAREALAIILKLWTAEEPFDYPGGEAGAARGAHGALRRARLVRPQGRARPLRAGPGSALLAAHAPDRQEAPGARRQSARALLRRRHAGQDARTPAQGRPSDRHERLPRRARAVRDARRRVARTPGTRARRERGTLGRSASGDRPAVDQDARRTRTLVALPQVRRRARRGRKRPRPA
jgi:hypothetical protein